ncbi:22786_t:CDS:2, partial [Gigaspora rosea]
MPTKASSKRREASVFDTNRYVRRNGTPISKKKEHIAGDVMIEDIDIEIIRQQKIEYGSLRSVESGNKMGLAGFKWI